MSPTIRPAKLADREAIVTVVRDAFSHDDRDGQEQVDIVVPG